MTALTDRLQANTQVVRRAMLVIDELLEQVHSEPYESDSIEELEEKQAVRKRVVESAARMKTDLLVTAAEVDGIILGLTFNEKSNTVRLT